MEARLAKLEAVIPTLATKDDLKNQSVEIRSEMKAGFAEVRSEMKAGFAEIRGELKAGLADTRATMTDGLNQFIKWAIGIFLAAAGLFWGISSHLLNNATPKAPPPQQAPVVIQMPAAAAPARPASSP